MPDSQFDRDVKVLAQLARKAADEVELALAGLPNSRIAALRGHLALGVMNALIQGYLADRDTYRRADPVIPPTPVPKPRI